MSLGSGYAFGGSAAQAGAAEDSPPLVKRVLGYPSDTPAGTPAPMVLPSAPDASMS